MVCYDRVCVPVRGFLRHADPIALRVRVGSRFYRGMRRAVCAAAALAVSGLISPVGVNLLNLLCVSALGLPGLGLLHVIARMP